MTNSVLTSREESMTVDVSETTPEYHMKEKAVFPIKVDDRSADAVALHRSLIIAEPEHYTPPPRETWYGKRAGSKWPGWSRAAAWHGMTARSMYPAYDFVAEVEEERRNRPLKVWLRVLGVSAFFGLLIAYAVWAWTTP